MAQLSSQPSNATEFGNEIFMLHGSNVHTECTNVNVDCVRFAAHNVGMEDGRTTGEVLRALMDRAGMTVRAFAKAAGYSHGSGVQRYIEPDFNGMIKPDVAKRMVEALEGKGSPPIVPAEVYALVGLPKVDIVPETNGSPVMYEGASLERMRQDLPILGTALGADRVSKGLAIEQTYLYEDEVIGYFKRPVILDGRADAYGLYVQGSSMDPAFEAGSIVMVETKRPPRVGDNVVVYLRMNGEGHESDDGASARTVLLKRLVRRVSTHIELEQHNPRTTFTIAMADVLKIHRVIPWAELLS